MPKRRRLPERMQGDLRMSSDKTVWVVTGEFGRLPGGVFSSKEQALCFIRRYSLTCTLSELPLDESNYDHAVRNGLFTPHKPHQSEPSFIAEFSPRLYHLHFVDGQDGTE